MKNRILTFALVIFSFGVFGQAKLQLGTWRGTFSVAGGNQAPFNFELTKKEVFLLNADERFEIKGYSIKGDSIIIPIDIFDATLAAKIENSGLIAGRFIKNNTATPDAGIPFTAEANKKYRFFERPQEATVSLQGTWDLSIGTNGNKTVGLFNQTGSKLTGTIMSTTGDYRFFEGSVKGNEFYLSAFSGSNPTLIKGKISGDELSAEFIGFRGTQTIKGTRNDKAALPDAYTLTTIKEGSNFTFSFPDAFTGKLTSLQDPKYKGKAVIVTILGSWCPNCIDEALFLSPWYKANKNRGVEIIGLAFERKNDPVFAKQRLETLKKRFDIEYDILFAGLADKKFASEALPALSEVLSFPTTIYIDKFGKVRKIHTGYTGPATGRYYEEFVKEFNNDVNELLKSSETKSAKR